MGEAFSLLLKSYFLIKCRSGFGQLLCPFQKVNKSFRMLGRQPGVKSYFFYIAEKNLAVFHLGLFEQTGDHL